MQHARRTVGFFKVRGVNINHNELEDLMFYNANVQDFKAEVISYRPGPRRAAAAGRAAARRRSGERQAAAIGEGVQKTFEVTPEIAFLEPGTLGKEFEASIKAARFVDKRG